MRTLILSLLLVCSPVQAKTIIIPVQDIMMQIPTFANAPTFNLNNSFYGGNPIGNSTPQPRKTRRQREKELIDFMWVQYPDAQSINIYNGNLVMRIPDR